MNLENVDIFTMTSFMASIASLVLAVVAIFLARSSAKESRDNYEKTKDVLAKINTRSAVIETTVHKSQDQLMATVTKIIDEIVIPKKEDPKQAMLLKLMTENPQMQEMAMAFMKENLKKRQNS